MKRYPHLRLYEPRKSGFRYSKRNYTALVIAQHSRRYELFFDIMLLEASAC